jgi:hypothetical protein
LFSGGEGLSGERLGAWFDRATATLGGRDVVETVRELLGNVSKFDFQQVGKDLPKVDLPDLERFFTQTVTGMGAEFSGGMVAWRSGLPISGRPAATCSGTSTKGLSSTAV